MSAGARRRCTGSAGGNPVDLAARPAYRLGVNSWLRDEQAPILGRWGFDQGWAEVFEPYARRGFRAARVVGVDRGAIDLVAATGEVRATLGGAALQSIATDPLTSPCSGDWAAVRSWPDGQVTVEAVLARRTAVVRASASGESRGHVLAANVDTVLITVALDCEPNAARVERLVTLAWQGGATPVLVLTKADLATDAEFIAEDLGAAAPGVEVYVVSSVTGQGLDRLRVLAAPGRTLALIGQSGVGKSTLVNQMSGRASVRVADIGARGKGRHTTVRRELIALPGGAMLLDTPGLRGVGVIDIGEGSDGLTNTFPEIEALSHACRFADCSHDTEPGCAVLAAADEGSLPLRRLESWRKLGKEARWIAMRGDARARAVQRRKWASNARSLRKQGIVRP